MRRHWAGGVLAALAATALAVLPVAPASAAAPPVLHGCSTSGHYEVCFTDPGTTDGRAIVDRLRELVQSTHDGDTVRIALYGWTLTGLADDVAEAHGRGVDVRVVIDEKNVGDPAYEILTSAHVPMTVCYSSCMGDHIMHNKFFLFDIGGTRSVVQTSFNATHNQLDKYNNLVRITGDQRLYEYYTEYWDRLSVGSWTYAGTTWGNDDRHRLGSLATKAYVFPRTDTDPVLGVLRNVTNCKDGHKKIYLAESIFTSAREKIRNRLGYMEDVMGCNVAVVVRQASQEKWAQSTSSGGYNIRNSKVRHINLHHKFLVIDAYYNGSWQRVVWTGSHNLNGPSLHHNDEAIVRITDSFVYQRYHDHYVDVYEAAGQV